MSVTVVVGAQWGDEGKGKIIDYLAVKLAKNNNNIVARYQGGANAGHTIYVNEQKYVLHLIPSGILQYNITCVIGNGVVLDPNQFLDEVDELRLQGLSVDGRILISNSVHITTEYHRSIDDPGGLIGSTKKGIGPTYTDKIARKGLRAVDLFSSKKTEEFVNQLSITQLEKTNILNQLNRAIERGFLNYIHDTSLYLNEAIKNGSQVLAEGAQGTLLDIDHGTYPYVTSSNTVAGAACTGLGIGPTKITSVIGVVKAYSTRVGNGPFVSQMSLDTEEHIRLKGKEYGATTGRARRCGWLDMVALKHSCRVNGITHLALTKIDVLDGLDKVKVCTGYKYNDEIFSEVPTSLEVLEKCEPIFTTFDGWPDRSRLSGKNQTLASLDPNERKYLQFIWQSLGVEPMIISTGPERDQTILI